jgi:hypothetical protein
MAAVRVDLHILPDIEVAGRDKDNLVVIIFRMIESTYPPVHPDISPTNLLSLPLNGNPL